MTVRELSVLRVSLSSLTPETVLFLVGLGAERAVGEGPSAVVLTGVALLWCRSVAEEVSVEEEAPVVLAFEFEESSPSARKARKERVTLSSPRMGESA